MKKIKRILIISLLASCTGVYAISNCENNGNVRAKNLQENKNFKTPSFNYYHATIDPDFTVAAEMTVHTVVHIKTEYQQKNDIYDNYFGFNDPFFQQFFGNPYQNMKPQTLQAAGSGVIISNDGYIVTNNHVVQDASLIEVTLNDKRTFEAKIVGTDPTTDIALIKIDAKDLPSITFGNSDSVKVGEWVLAVGNPFNLTSTVTAGIISAKGRNINILGGGTAIESFIQTDAAVNPGNSGGALVNTRGQLIGINAAIASNTGSYTGYSFAIPVNIVSKVIDDLLKYGEVQRAFLGAEFVELDSKLAKEKNIDEMKGVYVNEIEDGGAADVAGIKNGDVITAIDNTVVNNAAEAQELIGRHHPGDKISITFQRLGKEFNVDNVLLKNKSGGVGVVKKDETNVTSLLGATFEEVTKSEKTKLGISYGMKITKLDAGKLRSAGIKETFIITTIDNNPIKTNDDIKKALENKKGGVLIEGVYPNGMRAYYAFGL